MKSKIYENCKAIAVVKPHKKSLFSFVKFTKDLDFLEIQEDLNNENLLKNLKKAKMKLSNKVLALS